jgi:hypothetical protein
MYPPSHLTSNSQNGHYTALSLNLSFLCDVGEDIADEKPGPLCGRSYFQQRAYEQGFLTGSEYGTYRYARNALTYTCSG